jgi:hypothetical protein
MCVCVFSATGCGGWAPNSGADQFLPWHRVKRQVPKVPLLIRDYHRPGVKNQLMCQDMTV